MNGCWLACSRLRWRHPLLVEEKKELPAACEAAACGAAACEAAGPYVYVGSLPWATQPLTCTTLRLACAPPQALEPQACQRAAYPRRHGDHTGRRPGRCAFLFSTGTLSSWSWLEGCCLTGQPAWLAELAAQARERLRFPMALVTISPPPTPQASAPWWLCTRWRRSARGRRWAGGATLCRPWLAWRATRACLHCTRQGLGGKGGC